mmetsp:Transcript_37956/g.68090  ORF Transcript_37956/g.68090 Transcript_37956/m.68090 type:complete len:201 (+) Transcript_37956:220-822(+)
MPTAPPRAALTGIERPNVTTASRTPTAPPTRMPVTRPKAPPAVPSGIAPTVAAMQITCTCGFRAPATSFSFSCQIKASTTSMNFRACAFSLDTAALMPSIIRTGRFSTMLTIMLWKLAKFSLIWNLCLYAKCPAMLPASAQTVPTRLAPATPPRTAPTGMEKPNVRTAGTIPAAPPNMMPTTKPKEPPAIPSEMVPMQTE